MMATTLYARLFPVNRRIICLLFGLLVIGMPSLADPADCHRCSRKGFLTDFNNPHAPELNIPEQLDVDAWDEYFQCIANNWPTNEGNLDPNDPRIRATEKKCEHVKPTWEETPTVPYITKMGAGSLITLALTSRCFHLGADPEYTFEGMYAHGIKGEFDDRGRAIGSRLLIRLYYEGVYKEFLKAWDIKAHETATVNFIQRRMMALMKKDRPLEAFLWEYEKTPSGCDITLEEQTVMAGDTIDLRLSRFFDGFDRSAKDFNRIVVTAEQGRIIGGAPLKCAPSGVAAVVGKGVVSLGYKAPKSCQGSQDTIRVFNSCEIRDYDSHPLSNTEPWQLIGEQGVNLLCPGNVVLYMKSNSSHHYGSHAHSVEMTASVRVRLGETGGGHLPLSAPINPGSLMTFLTMEDAVITSFKARAVQESDSGRKEWTGSSPRFTPSKAAATNNAIILIRDPETKKAKHVIITFIGIGFDWSEEGAPCDPLLGFGPVQPYGDRRSAPVSMAWASDQEVTKGDGVRRAGGSGWKHSQDENSQRSYYWTWDIGFK